MKHPDSLHVPRALRAFSLIELLLVLFIMALLSVMAVPVFSKMVKGSRVQQASKQVLTMLWQARSEAERYRDPVVVFFGDDPALLPVKPIPGVMPAKGTMEMWSCARGRNATEDDFLWDEAFPYYVENPGAQCPNWYPHRAKLNNLTPIPGTLPEHVRVLCGNLLNGYIYWLNPTDWDHEFRCLGYRQDSIGELKRHQVAYGRNGGLLNQSYDVIVVYDDVDGDYQLIQVTTGGFATRPRMIPDRIKTIGGKPLKNSMDLPKMLSNLAPDS